MSQKVRVHLIIRGRVQGVCFRAYTEEEAASNGVTGWVRNTAEGTVEAVFEGDRKDVEKLVQWCHRGPDAARVTEAQVEWEPYRGDMPDFRITY